jgi:excisionase family DNA binding protein
MKQEKFLTLKETVKILNVSERSMFRYISSGRLKAAKIGSWRIKEEDIEEFIKKSFNNLKEK